MDQLSHSYVLDSQLQVVHLRVEEHDFVILNLLGLQLVKGGSNLGVVHIQALMLLVVLLLLLKLFHEHVLLVEEKLLSRTLDQLTVDFLGEREDVVERAGSLDPVHLDIKFLDRLVKLRLFAKLFKVVPFENFDYGVGNEAKVHLELWSGLFFLTEDALVVDD